MFVIRHCALRQVRTGGGESMRDPTGLQCSTADSPSPQSDQSADHGLISVSGIRGHYCCEILVLRHRAR